MKLFLYKPLANRSNDLTPTGLATAAGLGAVIARWEKFRFNPPPSEQQLAALAVLVGVDVERLVSSLFYDLYRDG